MAAETGLIGYIQQTPDIQKSEFAYGDERIPLFEESVRELGARFARLCHEGGLFIPEALLFIYGDFSSAFPKERDGIPVIGLNRQEAPEILRHVAILEGIPSKDLQLKAASNSAWLFRPNLPWESIGSDQMGHTSIRLQTEAHNPQTLEPTEMLYTAVRALRNAYGFPKALSSTSFGIASPFYGMEIKMIPYYESDDEVQVDGKAHRGRVDWIIHGIVMEGFGLTTVEEVLDAAEDQRAKWRKRNERHLEKKRTRKASTQGVQEAG